MTPSDSFSPTLTLKPDRYLLCRQCGISFVWTGWEQRETATPPELCPGCRHLHELTQRRRGVVKWYDRQKGYGFITASDGSEVFVHRHALGELRSLRRGQVVAFRVESTPSGPQAVDIQRLSSRRRRSRAHRSTQQKPKS